VVLLRDKDQQALPVLPVPQDLLLAVCKNRAVPDQIQTLHAPLHLAPLLVHLVKDLLLVICKDQLNQDHLVSLVNLDKLLKLHPVKDQRCLHNHKDPLQARANSQDWCAKKVALPVHKLPRNPSLQQDQFLDLVAEPPLVRQRQLHKTCLSLHLEPELREHKVPLHLQVVRQNQLKVHQILNLAPLDQYLKTCKDLRVVPHHKGHQDLRESQVPILAVVHQAHHDRYHKICKNPRVQERHKVEQNQHHQVHLHLRECQNPPRLLVQVAPTQDLLKLAEVLNKNLVLP
jgi:hypothetical protein